MKKAWVVIIICAALTAANAYAEFAGRGRGRVPRVEYLEPNNDSSVDLTDKKVLTFRWRQVPIPSGGREVYKFTLYKGYGHDVVVSETLDRGIFSIEISADKFENGAVYSWYVKQRDGRSMIWSLFDNWNFKVIKRR
jgi:hypothetical protein